MEHTTFLGHYRISTNYDGAPQELGRTGTAITYKARDSRSGEPVSLKLIPITSLDPEAQEQFEEQARTAQQLHHINIVKVLDFGKEAEQFVYVSEYYSLGATMLFLLTGIAPLAKTRLQQLRQFPKPLRNLLAHMLRANPDKRPQDPVALAEWIRECLLRIERRQAFARRLGIPLAATTLGKSRISSTPLAQVVGGIIVFAAVVLVTGLLAAFLLPADINPFRHRTAERQTIGVPVGVPDASPFAPSQPTNPTPVVANQPVTSGSPPSTGANQSPSPNPKQGQPPPSSQSLAATTSPSEASQTPGLSTQHTDQAQTDSTAPANVAPQPATANESSSPTQREKAAGLAANRARTGQSFLDERDSQSQARRGRSGRARVVGITSDGKLIFRLPSGRTAIVAPDSDEDQIAPRRQRRLDMERGQTVSPPPSELDNFPND